MEKDRMASAQEFRKAMRRVAASVNVITIRTKDGPMGMVATSVTSLTVEPASILVCISQGALIHNALIAGSRLPNFRSAHIARDGFFESVDCLTCEEREGTLKPNCAVRPESVCSGFEGLQLQGRIEV
jgi:hypothetical protein